MLVKCILLIVHVDCIRLFIWKSKKLQYCVKIFKKFFQRRESKAYIDLIFIFTVLLGRYLSKILGKDLVYSPFWLLFSPLLLRTGIERRQFYFKKGYLVRTSCYFVIFQCSFYVTFFECSFRYFSLMLAII